MSTILNLGFLNTRRGLLYTMDRKSEFMTDSGIKSIKQIFWNSVL